MLQSPVELANHLRRRPLLRGKNVGRSFGSVERIIDIDGYAETARGQFRVNMYRVVAPDPLQISSAGTNIFPRSAEEAEAQRLQHPDARVVGRAPANAHQDAAATATDGVGYQFARPVSGGLHHVAYIIRYKGEPACRGHFEDGCPPVGCDSVSRFDGLPQRTVNCRLHDFPAGGLRQCVHGALAAVGNGQDGGLARREDGSDAFGSGFSQFGGAETAFKRVYCKNNMFHFLQKFCDAVCAGKKEADGLRKTARSRNRKHSHHTCELFYSLYILVVNTNVIDSSSFFTLTPDGAI